MIFNIIKIIFTGLLFLLLLPVMALIFLLVKITSKGPGIHWSKRIGKNNNIFLMPKFRTMTVEAPQLATHLMTKGESYITPLGSFLRKTSLDELPQIWSILKGDMNFVGPRPALFNQDDLVALRTSKNVHTIPPGITGWAQINGRDELSIPDKVSLDEFYLKNMNPWFDMKIIMLTAVKVLKKSDISH